jgi:hypothetical protein
MECEAYSVRGPNRIKVVHNKYFEIGVGGRRISQNILSE